MKYIKIQNKGVLDAKLIPLMGGTTKQNDNFKIGKFGSGLKYSLAYLIRNGISFKIFVGEREVLITSIKETIANQEFDIIYIDGERTSITAQMGLDWNPWMIIREIWCNALDEGNANRIVTEECIGKEESTTFYLEYNISFAKVWQNWHNYFIQDFEPLFENDKFGVYPGTDKLRLYKQGVLIYESNTDKGVFNYNIKYAEINELREFKGSVSLEVFQCLANLSDSKVITNFLETVTEDFFEGKALDYDWSVVMNKAWKDTIGDAKIIHKQAVDNIKAKGLKIDLSTVLIVPKNLYKKLTKSFEGIGVLRVANKVNEFYEIYDAALELLIKQALVILEECKYDFSPELKFVYGVFGDKNIFAQVSLDKKEVLISENIKDKSLFQVVSTLIEENEHFKTGLSDETRAFQQHFIDLYTKTLLNKHEVKL